MNLRKLSIAISMAALLASAASLHATPISFTWTAVALPDSTLDGQTFSGDIVFTGNSDTAHDQANPIVTGGQNYGFESIGPVDFFIPSLDATGTTADTAFIVSFSSGFLKFALSPNGVTSDAGDQMLSGLTGFDLFNTNQTETGSQFVEALGTAPVSSAAIDGQSVSNTSLFLDIDPNQNATFTETVGAPEPATWSTLLTGALALLLAARATVRAARWRYTLRNEHLDCYLPDRGASVLPDA